MKQSEIIHNALYLYNNKGKWKRLRYDFDKSQFSDGHGGFARKIYEDIEPCPLDHETLIKSHFEYNETEDAYFWLSNDNEGVVVRLNGITLVQGKRDGDYAPLIKKRVRYAHELQEAINVCGIDTYLALIKLEGQK